MIQEDKDLLIKDLCARLPYRVKFKHSKGFDTFEGIVDDLINPTNEHCYDVEDIKPYLFPLSSMTEEQYMSLKSLLLAKKADFIIEELEISAKHYQLDSIAKSDLIIFDWLNEHHFDIHGLIDKGLAIDATGLNIY